MSLTRRNVMALVAVVVAAGLGAFVILDLVFANQMTPARAAGMLEKASPALVSVLKTDFNADFSRIVKATVEHKTGLTGDQAIASFLDAETRPIAERFGEIARRAPPDLVADWMKKRADALEAVQKTAGADLCARYADQGQSALADPATLAALAPAFDARDAAFFVALAGARDAPVDNDVGEATDSDWSAVEAAMNGLEVPAGYAQIVQHNDVRSRDYCSALSYYFRTVAALPGAAGQRIRAEYLVQSFS